MPRCGAENLTESDPQNNTDGHLIDAAAINTLFYVYLSIPCLFIGICGNILNLITLQNRLLQTEPFMYIRAMAVFDLCALTLIVSASFRNNGTLVPRQSYLLALYQAHIEYALLNTFLCASMYCAVVLTIERYIMLCHPIRHMARRTKSQVGINISIVLLLACMLHVPIGIQFAAVYDDVKQEYTVTDNKALLCTEPWGSIYGYYKWVREGVRFIGILLLTVLNVVIIRGMRDFGERRRSLHPKRSCVSVNSQVQNQIANHNAILANDGSIGSCGGIDVMSNSSLLGTNTLRSSSIMNSTTTNTAADSGIQLMHINNQPKQSVCAAPRFELDSNSQAKQYAERKVTILMIVITILYIFGNLPMSINMIVVTDSMKRKYWYQIFRGAANLMEVLNHCLNFYVFCMASSEYSRAFLHTCTCFRTHFWSPLSRRLTWEQSSSGERSNRINNNLRDAPDVHCNEYTIERDKYDLKSRHQSTPMKIRREAGKPIEHRRATVESRVCDSVAESNGTELKPRRTSLAPPLHLVVTVETDSGVPTDYDELVYL